jgi:MoaA/NifB/PqqE/SkfB family radical SAM enzyme
MISHNLRGIAHILSRRPGLLSPAAVNFKNRFAHNFLNHRSNGSLPAPELVTVMVTDICNLRCRMCQFAHSDLPGFQLNRKGMMNPFIFQKLMVELPGRPVVALTGGEPLLHPQINEIIRYARRHDRLVSLTTNGWFLAQRAAQLCEAGLPLLVVSVDGPREIHNCIRGRRSFERLQEGILSIMQMPKRPLVFISMAISNHNYAHLPAFYEMAVGLGIDGLNINHLWMQTTSMVADFNQRFNCLFTADKVHWDANPEEVDIRFLADTLETLRERNRTSGRLMVETPFLSRAQIGTWYQEPERFVKWAAARCAWNRMKVWPDGSVKPCRGWTAGNIATQHTWDIWAGSYFEALRSELNRHGALPICTRCCAIAHR